MQKYNIKISGGGTQEQIIKALSELIKSLKGSTPVELEKTTFEDSILCTEIHSEE